MDQSKPKMKYKTFTYHTSLEWTGARAGELRSQGKPDIRAGSPPEFKGEEGVWSPEDLFVASVEICTLTTFLAYVQKSGLPLVSYNSQAEGLMEFTDGDYRFTKITLRPTVVVEREDHLEQAEKLMHSAHDHCFIANSITTEVILEPRIRANA